MISWESPIEAPDWAGEPVIQERNHRPVVISFAAEPETPAPGLTDLSHLPKALVQGEGVSRLVGGLKPGQAARHEGVWLGCLTPDEAVAWALPGGQLDMGDYFTTDMTEAWALLALFGPGCLAVVQGLFAVDVERPRTDGPVYLAAPCHGVRVQVLNPKAATQGFLLACARSDAQFFYDSCLGAGKELGLKPVGLEACSGWLSDPS